MRRQKRIKPSRQPLHSPLILYKSPAFRHSLPSHPQPYSPASLPLIRPWVRSKKTYLISTGGRMANGSEPPLPPTPRDDASSGGSGSSTPLPPPPRARPRQEVAPARQGAASF